MFESVFSNRIPNYIGESKIRHSAVCIPLILKDDGSYDILFTVRSSAIGSQPGDVCLPGGKLEKGEGPQEAAIREAMEELLIRREQLTLIGPSDIFHLTNINVHPFLCYLSGYEDTFNRDEVAEVFCVPLTFFLQHEPDRYVSNWKVDLPEDFPYDKIVGGKNYKWRDRREEILFYEYDGHVIWGMTAKIIESFVAILKSGENRT